MLPHYFELHYWYKRLWEQRLQSALGTGQPCEACAHMQRTGAIVGTGGDVAAPGSFVSALPPNLPRQVKFLQDNKSVRNVVITSKYNLFTFVPICLYELLHPRKRFANFYFLCVGAMQCVPVISLSEGIPGIWVPLIMILTLDMAIMASEDMVSSC